MYIHGYGGPTGKLGFPLSDESDSPQGSKRYNTFQNGCLTWDKASGRMMLFEALELVVDSISGSGSHTIFESLRVSDGWVYTHVKLTTNTRFNVRHKPPAYRGSYGQPHTHPRK